MSEAAQRPVIGMIIEKVDPDSPADRAGIREGDILRAINGRTIGDIVDFRYHSDDLTLTFQLERGGLTIQRELERDYGEDLGIEFEFELADNIHTCKNKCVFCFIHQMPKGMRKSLYLMDDDYRLSFLHGNYVTLTNMDETDFGRIIEQRMSPLYVSVHATDPKLRAFMLGKHEEQPILPRLRQLAEAGIEVHTQIVLCPGYNDGPALERTLDDLAELHPMKSGLRSGVSSAAIVPVGLSRFRDRLYPLKPVTPPYAEKMLKTMAAKNRQFINELGTRFAFLSDEWFFLASKPMPSRKWYEDFPQLEDGVGTCRLFLDEAARVEKRLPERLASPFACTLVTSVLPSGVLNTFAYRLSAVEGLEVNVCTVENRFFGPNINVAGLITGQDIAASLREFGPHGVVFVPSICLKEETVFLDDITVEDLRQNTGLDIRVIAPRPRALWDAINATQPKG